MLASFLNLIPSNRIVTAASWIVLGFAASTGYGQTFAIRDNGQDSPVNPEDFVVEIADPTANLEIEANHSKLIRTRFPVGRISIVDPTVVEVNQFDPTNLELLGLKEGATDVTLWFGDPGQLDQARVLRYRVEVIKSSGEENRRKSGFAELEAMITEFFPNSSVELILVADKLIIRGQARDAEEAANILAIIRRNYGNGRGGAGNDWGGGISQGAATNPNDTSDQLSATGIVNLLRVQGEQQVLLKVRVAELTRSALRELGVDFQVNKNNISVSSSLGNTGNLIALLDNQDVSLMLKALSTNGYSKVLAEPNLVTLSGRTASFIAGGQFAVPTAVGVGGVQAASTSFQGFGTQLQFTPTVLDKDRIRLRVAPTFSSLNNDNKVNGIPGLNTRSVFTTVDMREGQWLAVAGLIQDQQQGSKARVPFLGDMPLGGTLFGKNFIKRDETELLILVSPQLIRPLEADAAPDLLPGMEVKEPNNIDFFLRNRIEGPTQADHRSTVWPQEREAIRSSSMSAPASPTRGHARKYYVRGSHGFSNQ